MVKLAAVFLSAVFAVPVLGGTREMTFADGYNGGSWVESVEQTISFSTKDDQEIAFNGGLPKYYNVSSYTNTCANVAGTTVLGYYDQYYDNLIENFTSATIIFGYTIYNTQTDAVQAVINQLYIDMDTNVTEGGTTINGFKNGMVTYVARKNRQLTYSQIVSGSAVLMDTCTSMIEDGIPAVVFVSKYSLVSTGDFEAETGTEDVFVQHYGGNHTLVVYGVRTIKYYSSTGTLVRQLDLLKVTTGYADFPLAYLLLDDYTNVIDGFAVNIY